MKVTCIVGSARADGSCAYLIDTFIRGLNGRAEVKKYYVAQSNIRFCCGCKQCYNEGVCIYDDDVKQIVADIVSSDVVVIASPSYWADVPAQLKVFFDRNTPFGDTNPKRILKAEKPVKGVAIAVRAGVRQQENDLILNAIQHYFGHLGIETVERISVCQTETLHDLLENHQKEIGEVFDLGNRMGEII